MSSFPRLLAIFALSVPLACSAQPGAYGYGTPATDEEIAGWDIDIRPDGQGLPEGQGSVEDGEWIYEEQCAECHGTFGEGVGRYPSLAGGEGTLTDPRPHKTVGSYWPHTSTLWDYIHRAMPFTQPESMTDDEVYAVTAYVLYLNDLVEDDFELNHENLADIELPNRASFIPDNRPDTFNKRCMKDCKDPASVSIASIVEPVAPASTTTVMESTSATTVSNGKPIYDQACGLCHNSGLAGAPELGDSAEWARRLSAGKDTLIKHALEGYQGEKGMMPPKGGFTHLTDEEVSTAVIYMLEQSQ